MGSDLQIFRPVMDGVLLSVAVADVPPHPPALRLQMFPPSLASLASLALRRADGCAGLFLVRQWGRDQRSVAGSLPGSVPGSVSFFLSLWLQRSS